MVTFAPMNLAQVVYMGKFDCIFCMNVLIYFSEDGKPQLIQRFYEYWSPVDISSWATPNPSTGPM